MRDEVRPQPLQRADRRAVVAVLGVVVVLDDQRVVLGRPGEQLRPPLGAEHRAGRELVGGREQDRARVVRKLVDDDAVLVDAGRHGDQPALGEQPADALVARVLDRELDRPERLGERHERLAGARAQDHVVGARDAAPDAPAVSGDDLAQRDRARDRGIVELGDTGAAHRGAERAHPVRAGEAREVGPAGPQVVADARGAGDRAGRDPQVVRRMRG